MATISNSTNHSPYIAGSLLPPTDDSRSSSSSIRSHHRNPPIVTGSNGGIRSNNFIYHPNHSNVDAGTTIGDGGGHCEYAILHSFILLYLLLFGKDMDVILQGEIYEDVKNGRIP
ncbi:hypothetical protein BLA29_009106 [Euroglyphus maynei]|uniref:Uncharacterized protein n=1 Tax=Euroglyphus maynei TaxID=6958 RepID=A0A1Y3B601_EURMA|nr:hypothetical protein BLA29_009106 [Euroglyphus maynei]